MKFFPIYINNYYCFLDFQDFFIYYLKLFILKYIFESYYYNKFLNYTIYNY